MKLFISILNPLLGASSQRALRALIAPPLGITLGIPKGIAVLAIASLTLLPSHLSFAALPAAVDGQPLPTLAPMLERVKQSMVSVSVEADVRPRRRSDPFFDDPFFRRFFDQRSSSQTRKRFAFGAGVVVDAQAGLILTNEHSIVGARNILITLADGRELQGRLLGSDKASDVALVKVDADNLTAIRIGNSNGLRVGDFVVSVGDEKSSQSTVTSGIISSLGRSRHSRNFQRFIQSDAGYGPGILVNLRGELIGLNISKVTQTVSNSRIGFSTPVNMAIRVKDQLLKFGTPQRGFMAVQVQDLTPELATAFNIGDSRGAVITSVTENSAAYNGGIRVGDVVLMADKSQVTRGRDLRKIIGQHFSGDPLELQVLRQGQTHNLTVMLESSSPSSQVGTMMHERLEGATFKDVGAEQVSTNVEQGVMVTNVTKGSVAWGYGVRPNDIIVSANRKSVANLDSFRQAIANQDVLMLNIVRGNGALFLLLQ